MIGIIDYGMGNLHSVKNACDKLGLDCVISSQASVLDQCTKLILPGVGAFQDCMKSLKETGLYEYIIQRVSKGTYLLGICLGMQALFESSQENGYCQGFGFLKGEVVFMDDLNVRIPQIGWNELEKNQDHVLFDRMSSPYVYYVHSYYAKNVDDKDLIGYSTYGNMKITGLVVHEHIMGCQFHPEKSGEDGLKILEYFGKEFV